MRLKRLARGKLLSVRPRVVLGRGKFWRRAGGGELPPWNPSIGTMRCQDGDDDGRGGRRGGRICLHPGGTLCSVRTPRRGGVWKTTFWCEMWMVSGRALGEDLVHGAMSSRTHGGHVGISGGRGEMEAIPRSLQGDRPGIDGIGAARPGHTGSHTDGAGTFREWDGFSVEGEVMVTAVLCFLRRQVLPLTLSGTRSFPVSTTNTPDAAGSDKAQVMPPAMTASHRRLSRSLSP